jgi:hypothetical protein
MSGELLQMRKGELAGSSERAGGRAGRSIRSNIFRHRKVVRRFEGVRAVAQEEDEEDPVDRPRIPRLEPKRLCSSSRCMICVTATERFSCC